MSVSRKKIAHQLKLLYKAILYIKSQASILKFAGLGKRAAKKNEIICY